jgi:hypothetical protein
MAEVIEAIQKLTEIELQEMGFGVRATLLEMETADG